MKKFTWGWITVDGVRHKSNGETNATPSQIIGIWGKRGDAYYETFTAECLPEQGKVNNWTLRPLATLLDINKARLLAFIKNKKLAIHNVVGAPEPEPKEIIKQTWKCPCSHSFYTDLDKMPSRVKRVCAWIKALVFPVVIDCENCHAKTARKTGIVKK